jgi:membrane fusion protein, multidrug efflux system
MAACSRSDKDSAMKQVDHWVRRGMWGVVITAASATLAGPRTAPPADADRGSATLASRSAPAPADAPPALASAAVAARTGHGRSAYEGAVEALRQTVVAAQVPGAVVGLHVRAGDKVQAGQVLMRIDARAAEQGAMASAAQSHAARAALEEATRSFGRQQELFAQGFISRAALDRAQAQFKTAEAETTAQKASAGAARSQAAWYVVRSPYAGVVAKVSVVLGDMALPGRPLLTLYDPSALRVTAAIPQSVAAGLNGSVTALAEIPGAVRGLVTPARVQLLPVVDATSHTLELRMDLPADTPAAPGMFARAWLPEGVAPAAGNGARLFVPSEALVRRSELVGVYVIGHDGKPALRQVRPGRSVGSQVEVLSGVAAGERVALDPQAAARLR